MTRYMRRLVDRDIALDRSMIPLGSCTMKLNAAAEMLPLSWPEFSQVHPYAPKEQTLGYNIMIDNLSKMLCDVTGYDSYRCSLIQVPRRVCWTAYNWAIP